MAAKYADVIIDISHEKVDRPFQYKIPLTLMDVIAPGVRVHVPFGRSNQDKVAEENLPGDIFMGSFLPATSNFGAAVSRFFVNLESNRCWYTHQNFHCRGHRTAGNRCRHPNGYQDSQS